MVVGVQRVGHVAAVDQMNPNRVALADDDRRPLLGMERARHTLPVDSEHVGIALPRAVLGVLTGHHPVGPGVPLLDGHEVLLVGGLVPLRVDPENAVHSHVDVAVGLVVEVIEVRAGDVRRNLVGVFFARGDLNPRRRAATPTEARDSVGSRERRLGSPRIDDATNVVLGSVTDGRIDREPRERTTKRLRPTPDRRAASSGGDRAG